MGNIRIQWIIKFQTIMNSYKPTPANSQHNFTTHLLTRVNMRGVKLKLTSYPSFNYSLRSILTCSSSISSGINHNPIKLSTVQCLIVERSFTLTLQISNIVCLHFKLLKSTQSSNLIKVSLSQILIEHAHKLAPMFCNQNHNNVILVHGITHSCTSNEPSHRCYAIQNSGMTSYSESWHTQIMKQPNPTSMM